MRAISEIYLHNGAESLDITTEEDYYRWMFTGEAPRPESYPARLVWVE